MNRARELKNLDTVFSDIVPPLDTRDWEHKKYKKIVLPLIGNLITKNKEAYSYLSESIDLFPDQVKLKSILEQNGFVNVSYFNLFNGIVSIHIGYKI